MCNYSENENWETYSKDGKLEFAQFEKYMTESRRDRLYTLYSEQPVKFKPWKPSTKELFEMLDVDCRGWIDREQFIRFAKTFGTG